MFCHKNIYRPVLNGHRYLISVVSSGIAGYLIWIRLMANISAVRHS